MKINLLSCLQKEEERDEWKSQYLKMHYYSHKFVIN